MSRSVPWILLKNKPASGVAIGTVTQMSCTADLWSPQVSSCSASSSASKQSSRPAPCKACHNRWVLISLAHGPHGPRDLRSCHPLNLPWPELWKERLSGDLRQWNLERTSSGGGQPQPTSTLLTKPAPSKMNWLSTQLVPPQADLMSQVGPIQAAKSQAAKDPIHSRRWHQLKRIQNNREALWGGDLNGHDNGKSQLWWMSLIVPEQEQGISSFSHHQK